MPTSTLSGEAERPQVAGAVIEARPTTGLRRLRLQSMEGSLPPPLLQNRACHFRGTRLLSEVPSGRGIRLAVIDSPEDL